MQQFVHAFLMSLIISTGKNITPWLVFGSSHLRDTEETHRTYSYTHKLWTIVRTQTSSLSLLLSLHVGFVAALIIHVRSVRLIDFSCSHHCGGFGWTRCWNRKIHNDEGDGSSSTTFGCGTTSIFYVSLSIFFFLPWGAIFSTEGPGSMGLTTVFYQNNISQSLASFPCGRYHSLYP